MTARGTPTRTKSNVPFPKRRHAPTRLPKVRQFRLPNPRHPRPPIPPALLPSSSKSPSRRSPSDSRRLICAVGGGLPTGTASYYFFPWSQSLGGSTPERWNDVLLQPAPRSKAAVHLRLVIRVLEQLRAEHFPCLQCHLMHLGDRLRGLG